MLVKSVNFDVKSQTKAKSSTKFGNAIPRFPYGEAEAKLAQMLLATPTMDYFLCQVATPKGLNRLIREIQTIQARVRGFYSSLSGNNFSGLTRISKRWLTEFDAQTGNNPLALKAVTFQSVPRKGIKRMERIGQVANEYGESSNRFGYAFKRYGNRNFYDVKLQWWEGSDFPGVLVQKNFNYGYDPNSAYDVTCENIAAFLVNIKKPDIKLVSDNFGGRGDVGLFPVSRFGDVAGDQFSNNATGENELITAIDRHVYFEKNPNKNFMMRTAEERPIYPSNGELVEKYAKGEDVLEISERVLAKGKN